MQDVYEMCTTEKNSYLTGPGVLVAGGWYFKMSEHNDRTILMKNSQFPETQVKLGTKPVKNIILPILSVAHRTEGFDVKDIEVYVEDKDNFHLSFLARKFYYKWAIENKLDTFIDEVVEALDYGYVLVKNVNNKRPEVVQPQQIAFCDQTDILSGTIALKHNYSIDQLIAVGEESGWNKDQIDIAIQDARKQKSNSENTKENSVPDKHIEVFEIEGTFPEMWLKKNGEDYTKYNEELKADAYCLQTHIICYVKDTDGKNKGICLYKGRREKTIFKVLVINPVYGRAAGRGRVEELFEPQVWTNFGLIHMTNMLKEASKVIQVTTDTGFTTRNNTKNSKGGDVFTLDEGKIIAPLNTQPVNYQLFDNFILGQEQHARTLGSASDPALGLNPVSGTPLGTTEIVTNQGQGIHEYNQGKIAVFIHEIHMDWILEYLINDMNKGLEWADDLSLEEMQKLSQDIMVNVFNDYIKKKIVNGEDVTEEELVPLREQFKKDFMKNSTKFLQILKKEFESLPLKLKINVAGKQSYQAKMIEKLGNIWRAIFANPQGFMTVMQIPGAAESFNAMLEMSGLKQMDFSQMPAPVPEQGAMPSPIQQDQLAVNK